MARNKPVRHVVSSHRREGKPVRSYLRGSGERKQRYWKAPDYLSERLNAHDLKSGQEIIYKGVPIKLGKIVRKGQFVSGTDNITVNSISVRGKPIFNEHSYYVWDDPDYPHNEDVRKAMKEAKEAGEEGEDAWTDHLDYSDSSYKFKSSGFKIYGDSRSLSVDAMPKDIGLGRISIEDLQDEDGSPIWSDLKK